MDLSKILAQLGHPSTDIQLDGVTGARKIAPALPPQHPDRPALLKRLGELASYHGFGERPLERPVPPPIIVPAAGTLELPADLEPVGTLATAFAAHGAELVAVATGGELLRWDLLRGSPATRTRLAGAPLVLASLAPELDRVACRAPGGSILICDAATGGSSGQLGDGASFSALAWTPCGRRLATGTTTGDVSVWEAASGRRVSSWWAHPAPVQALTFDPDGGVLATGGADGRISLWAAESGRRTVRVVEPGDHPHGLSAATRAGSPRSLIFTGGGAYLVAGLTGGGLLLWDRESGHRLWTPPAHAASIRAVRTVHGGLSLASAGQDGALTLWDALTGEPLAMLAGHVNAAATLVASPDGARLASGGLDPWVLLWDLPARTYDMNEHACRRALALYARRALERLGPPRTPD